MSYLKRKIMSVMTTATTFVIMGTKAFAEGENGTGAGGASDADGIIKQIQDGSTNLLGDIRQIAYPLIVLVVALVGIKLVLGGTKETAEAKQKIIIIVGATALIILAPFIVTTIYKIFSNSNMPTTLAAPEQF